MRAPLGPPRPGDVVRIRDERWRVLSHASHGEAAILDAAGCGAANRNTRARFLLPFEPIDCLPPSPEPRVVRPAHWRRVARGVLAEATPSWTSLRAAASANLTLMPFQLEPALAFVAGHACRFLMADGVGLGKTVQAGLMIAELLARQPGAHALVISPAALREQWRHELRARFHLDAEVFDAAGVARAAADIPAGINPWSLPRITVTSIDYIKRPEIMRSLEALTWDFVVFDEAHNLAGRSDRAAAAQTVARRSRAVALLTATPHSGDDQTFQKLCGIGDVGSAYPLLVFRRTRAAAGMAGLRRTITLRVRPTPAEAAMHAALIAYGRRAWAESTGDRAAGARLAITVLARRACSSAGSLARSVERRLALLREGRGDPAQLHLPFADVSQDDEEPGRWLGSGGLHDAAEERALLQELLGLARSAATRESKPAWIARFLGRIDEPAIVFTEYRDTLERLTTAFATTESVELHGGLTSRERVDAISRFTAGRARLLLATDAASEGLNLHQRCRLVINLELPWTPVRLDQRAGRVDRIGQPRAVHAIRLVAADTCEESIVARLAVRADRIRNALEAAPDEALAAASVFAAPPAAAPRVVPTPAVINVDLQRDAIQEAARLGRARAWLASAGGIQHLRPVISRLRARRASRQRLWAFRLAMITAANHVLWETVIAAGAALLARQERSVGATRAMLRYGPALRQALDDAGRRRTRTLQAALRRPLALWVQRELDVIEVIRQDHARMSAPLLQAGLFDRRTDREAAAQAATLDAALSRCRGRLGELRACEDLRSERCELAFAVILD